MDSDPDSDAEHADASAGAESDEKRERREREERRKKRIRKESLALVEEHLAKIMPKAVGGRAGTAGRKYTKLPKIFKKERTGPPVFTPGQEKNGKALHDRIKPLIEQAEKETFPDGKGRFRHVDFKILTTNSNTLHHQTVERLFKQEMLNTHRYQGNVSVSTARPRVCVAATPALALAVCASGVCTSAGWLVAQEAKNYACAAACQR